MIQPDKKSVLIYLTCLYEAFSAPPSVSANQNTSVSSSPVKPVNAQMSYSSPASNLDSTSAALTDTRDNLPHTQNSTSTNTYSSQQPSQNGQELEAVQFPLQASSAPNVTNQVCGSLVLSLCSSIVFPLHACVHCDKHRGNCIHLKVLN